MMCSTELHLERTFSIKFAGRGGGEKVIRTTAFGINAGKGDQLTVFAATSNLRHRPSS